MLILSARNRADRAVPRPLRRAFRLPPRGMAFRSVAKGTPPRLSRGDAGRSARGGRRALGAVSAVPDLGLIIVDEEHEQAYKQEDGAIYHARDMAVVRGRMQNCPVVLASATPSLETYVNATSGRYLCLKLASRHGVAVMPEVSLIDLREARGDPGTWLSPPLREALAVTLGAGEQAMLFLNRRGYAPLTLCESCGHKMVCRIVRPGWWSIAIIANSSAIIAATRRRRRRAVPHARRRKVLSRADPASSAWRRNSRACFPRRAWRSPRAIRCTDRPKRRRAIRAMAKREIDVLIGTQIVAKGHHFPAIDAGGRGRCRSRRLRRRSARARTDVPAVASGGGTRGPCRKPGLVLIQTRNPDDAVMQALAAATATRSTNRNASAQARVGPAFRPAGGDHPVGP